MLIPLSLQDSHICNLGRKGKCIKCLFFTTHSLVPYCQLLTKSYVYENVEPTDNFLNSSAIKWSPCRLGFSIRLGPIYSSFFRKALSPSQVAERVPIINGIFSSKHTGSNQLASKVGHTFCCCQTELIRRSQRAESGRPGHHRKRRSVARQQSESRRRAGCLQKHSYALLPALFYLLSSF